MSEVSVPVSVSVTYSEPFLLLAEYSPVVAGERGGEIRHLGLQTSFWNYHTRRWKATCHTDPVLAIFGYECLLIHPDPARVHNNMSMYATGVMHEGDIEHEGDIDSGRVICTAHKRRSPSTGLLHEMRSAALPTYVAKPATRPEAAYAARVEEGAHV